MMAKLQRFIKLNDRFDSQVFTFMLPAKLITDTNPDTYTKDITYGYHKWTAIFTRTNVHLGCYLKLMSGCEGMKCQIDFSYTLLNREHFTRNETFIEKGCVFTQESTQHGRKNFVALGELVERDFAQASGEFLFELEMRKINCIFECYIRLPRETPNTRYTSESRLESSYFSYGLCDWSISLSQIEGSLQQDEHINIQLHRHTSFDHICNVRYFITLGENGAFQSEEMDQLVDTTGNGEVLVVNGSLHQLARGRSSLRLKVTMVSVVTVSEVTLNVASRSNSRAHLYDKDKQAWLMEADTTGKYLTLCLYYTDVTHVPRKYSRYVCWNILVLTRYIPDRKVKTNYGPFSRYYVQQDLDEGYHIYTTIPVDELHDERCLYTEPDDPRITVHIEWVDSHLLAQPSYNANDDIDKLQKHQMKREIIALQSENLALEKQLLVYQQSISKAVEKENDVKKRGKTPSAFDKAQTREQRLIEKAAPISTTPSQTPTERKASRDESGYYSDKTGGFYNGATTKSGGTTHSDKTAGYYDDPVSKTRRDQPTDTANTGGINFTDRSIPSADPYVDKLLSGGSFFEKTTCVTTDKVSSRDTGSYLEKTTGGSSYNDKIIKSSSYMDKASVGNPYGEKISTSGSYYDKSMGDAYYGDTKSGGNGMYVDKTTASTKVDKKGRECGYVDKMPTGVTYGDKASKDASYFEKTPGGAIYVDKQGRDSPFDKTYSDKTSRDTGYDKYGDKSVRDPGYDKNPYGDKMSKEAGYDKYDKSYSDKTGRDISYDKSYGDKSVRDSGFDKNPYGDKMSRDAGYDKSYSDKASRDVTYDKTYGDKIGRESQGYDKTSGVSAYSDKAAAPTNYMDSAGAFFDKVNTPTSGYANKTGSSGYYSDKTTTNSGGGRSSDRASRKSGYDEKPNGRGSSVEKTSSSGYHSDRSDRSYYKEKVPTEYYDKPRSERSKHERRRSSNREGREKTERQDRSASAASTDRLSYRYR